MKCRGDVDLYVLNVIHSYFRRHETWSTKKTGLETQISMKLMQIIRWKLA